MRQMIFMILVITSYAQVASAKLVVTEDGKTAILRQKRDKLVKELFGGSNATCFQAIASTRVIIVSDPTDLADRTQNLLYQSAALFCMKLGISYRVSEIIDTFSKDLLCSSRYLEEQLKEVREGVKTLQADIAIANDKERASNSEIIREANINLETALSYLNSARNLRPQDCGW